MKIIWFLPAYIKKKPYLCSRNNKDNNSLKPKSRKGIKIMKTYTFAEIANKYGENIARQAIEIEAEATSRVIYPAFEPEHADKSEWAAQGSVEAENGDTIQAFWYLTDEDEENLDFFDWESNVEFQIEEA